jgi:hypothetical protein
MPVRRVFLALAGALVLTAQVQNASFTVNVEGKPLLTFTAADLATMPRHTVTTDQHGKQIQYEGVYMRDVLSKAGVPFGSELKGKKLSTYVLAVAHDGYAVVYTLAEMDPEFSEGDLLIADKVGGQPQGPFRIIAPHDKKPARSLRMLERIEVVQLVN